MGWYIVIIVAPCVAILALLAMLIIFVILARGIGGAAGEAAGTWAKGNFGPRH